MSRVLRRMPLRHPTLRFERRNCQQAAAELERLPLQLCSFLQRPGGWLGCRVGGESYRKSNLDSFQVILQLYSHICNHLFACFSDRLKSLSWMDYPEKVGTFPCRNKGSKGHVLVR